MAGKGDIRAGKAFVELFVKTAAFEKGLRSASRSLASFGSSIQTIGTKVAAMGTVAVGGLAAVTRAFIKVGDSAVKASQRTGLTIKAFQELAYAADVIAGATADDFEAAMRTMQKQVGKLGEGNKAAADTFSDLGISASAFLAASPEDRFLMLVDALGKVDDSGKRAALAMEVFGKSGTKMLPLIEAGAEGVAEARKEFEKLGIALSPEQAKQAEQLGDAFGRIKTAATGAAVQIGAALAPALQKMAAEVTRIIPQITQWIKNNQEAIVTLAKLAAGVTATGFAMVAFGTALKGLATAFTITASLISMASAISKLALLTNPYVLAVGALGVALVKLSGITSELTSRLGPVATAMTDAFEALTSGEISEAVDILAKSFEYMASVAKDSFAQIPKYARKAAEEAANAIREFASRESATKSVSDFAKSKSEQQKRSMGIVSGIGIPTVAGGTTIEDSAETKKIKSELDAMRGKRQGKRDGRTFRDALAGMGGDPGDPFATPAPAAGGGIPGLTMPGASDGSFAMPEADKTPVEEFESAMDDLMTAFMDGKVGLEEYNKAADIYGKKLADATAEEKRRADEEAASVAEKANQKRLDAEEEATRFAKEQLNKGDVSVSFSAAALMAQGRGGRGNDTKGTLDATLDENKRQTAALNKLVEQIGVGVVLAFR